MIDGLYFDTSIARYLFAALMLLFLAGSSLLKGGHSTLLKAHAATWLLLALSQLAWAIPVMLSQTDTTLFYAGVIGFGLYWTAATGSAVAFSAVFLKGRKLSSGLVVAGSIAFAFTASVVTWVDHLLNPPLFFVDTQEIDKEHLLLFKILFSLTLILFLPIGVYILRYIAPRLSGARRLVATMDGLATAGASLSGFVFLVGNEELVAPLFGVLSLFGLIMIYASWFNRGDQQSDQ